MTSSDSAEKQPEVPETQFLGGMAKLKIKAPEPEVEDLDDELCKTPTRPENQIRVINCPPAPRKKRPAPSSTPKRLFTVHVIVLQQTIDALFQQASSGQPSRGNKRRRRN